MCRRRSEGECHTNQPSEHGDTSCEYFEAVVLNVAVKLKAFCITEPADYGGVQIKTPGCTETGAESAEMPQTRST